MNRVRVETKTTNRESTAPRAATRAANGQPSKAAKKKDQPAGSDEGGPNGGDEEEEEEEPPKTPGKAGRKLLDTVRKETGARTAGLANTVTGLVKLVSDVAGLFGSLGREQLVNAGRVARRKHELLSRAGKNVTGGLINAMDSAHQVGGVGARTALGLLRDATETGKTAVETGGALLSAPVLMARHGMDVIRRAAQVPPAVTKAVSAALGAHSREAPAGEEEPEPEDDTPPPPPPPPRAPPKKK